MKLNVITFLALAGLSFLSKSVRANEIEITEPSQYQISAEVFIHAKEILLSRTVEGAKKLLKQGINEAKEIKGKHPSAISASKLLLKRLYELRQGIALDSTNSANTGTATYCLALTNERIPIFASLEERAYRKTLLNKCSDVLKGHHDSNTAISEEQLLFSLKNSEIIGSSSRAKRLMIADFDTYQIKTLLLQRVYEKVSRVVVNGQQIDGHIWNTVKAKFPYIDLVEFKFCDKCPPEVAFYSAGSLSQKNTVVALSHFLSGESDGLEVNYQLIKE